MDQKDEIHHEHLDKEQDETDEHPAHIQQSFTEKEIEFLCFIAVTNKKQNRLILQNLTSSQVNCLSEICFNILYSDDIDGQLLSDLKKYATVIRKVADRKSTLVTRRTVIAQHPAKIVSIVRLIECLLPYNVEFPEASCN